ncbi:PASTA domain-containing protein [Agreia sp. Leaf244]|uniref:PASTA domain-containing protein n=1 Tax=Agreia sp. Leaf244 TaxID=1736305 RepID=UPI0009EB324A|nr:PASTA domain-containing protein [Agreia sp. Leaf244]
MSEGDENNDVAGTDAMLTRGHDSARRRRGWLAGGIVALVAALVLAAGAGGWWIANMTLVASQQNSSEGEAASPVTISESQMPDVRGLDLATAEQVLADSGIASIAITTYDAPSVTEPGRVAEQSPAFGATDVTEVRLGLAVPVTMPDLAGMTQEEAIDTLSGYGVGVDIVFGYSPQLSSGVVMKSSPAVGEPLGQTASITVATAGSTVPLTQLSSKGGRCGSESNVAIDGKDYATALICRSDTAVVSDSTWIVSGSVDRFTATVGIPDDGSPGTAVPYEVLLDGVVVSQGSAAFGQSAAIDIPCSGAIQLTLRISPTGGNRVDIALGDAVLFGSEDGIARLSALS